ncbi:MAG: P-II family nitrogen regulator, partial [Nitrospirae bacterium]|nr:P-II family nitrogen regulator [Nitrospirota bacterium]
PEKEQETVLALEGAGFPALTKFHVFGRGKEGGLKVGSFHYDELPKVLLMMVVEDYQVSNVVELIAKMARTGEIGDGKIFVSPVEEAYTIRTGEKGL